jgi:hypothetical protein
VRCDSYDANVATNPVLSAFGIDQFLRWYSQAGTPTVTLTTSVRRSARALAVSWPLCRPWPGHPPPIATSCTAGAPAPRPTPRATVRFVGWCLPLPPPTAPPTALALGQFDAAAGTLTLEMAQANPRVGAVELAAAPQGNIPKPKPSLHIPIRVGVIDARTGASLPLAPSSPADGTPSAVALPPADPAALCVCLWLCRCHVPRRTRRAAVRARGRFPCVCVFLPLPAVPRPAVHVAADPEDPTSVLCHLRKRSQRFVLGGLPTDCVPVVSALRGLSAPVTLVQPTAGPRDAFVLLKVCV